MYFENYKLRNLTWFKVGGNAQKFFMPQDFLELQNFLKTNSNQSDYTTITVLGAGSNVLISDHGIAGLVIKLGKSFNYIHHDPINAHLVVGASTFNYSIAQYCLSHSICNFEFLCSIPGTVGGGVVMNAGAYDREYIDILVQIKCLDWAGNVVILDLKDLNMSYRYSALQDVLSNLIVVEATLKYEQLNLNLQQQIVSKMAQIQHHRKTTQPISAKTCGSTFRNTTIMPAWKIVELLGFRGFQHGGAQVSTLHCNFLINTNNASAQDIWELGQLIKAYAKAKLHIDLIWEIKTLGTGFVE